MLLVLADTGNCMGTGAQLGFSGHVIPTQYDRSVSHFGIEIADDHVCHLSFDNLLTSRRHVSEMSHVTLNSDLSLS
jgi:hypothetical protein